MCTRQTVARVLGVLCELFPTFGDKQTPDSLTRKIIAYHAILYDIPDPLVERGALHYASDHTFFPSAGDLRNACKWIMERGQDIPLALDAWDEVCTVLRAGGFWEPQKVGGYTRRQPTAKDWSHPIIQQTIQGIGGWQVLRGDTPIGVNRAAFLRAFDVYKNRATQDATLLPVVREAVGELRASYRQGRGNQPLPLGLIMGEVSKGLSEMVDQDKLTPATPTLTALPEARQGPATRLSLGTFRPVPYLDHDPTLEDQFPDLPAPRPRVLVDAKREPAEVTP